MFNFLNYPAIRFKKPTAKTLGEFYDKIYDRFYTQEQYGMIMKDDYNRALSVGDAETMQAIEKCGGEVYYIDDIIDLLIDKFTLSQCNVEKLEYYRALILKYAKYIKDIQIDYEKGVIKFKTVKGNFTALKLTSAYPEMKMFDILETEKRYSRCHTDSVDLSVLLKNRNKVATGYVSTFSEFSRFLHSWVELNIDGKPCVIDTTRNLLMDRKGYYFIRNITGPVYKISDKIIEKEKSIYDSLSNSNGWLFKLYLSNRPQALQVYKILQQEKQKDPLYKAAKNMAESFERMQRQEKKSKKKNNSTSESSKY